MIARDLMVGNSRLKELGFGEEALGRNAIAAGFQGQRQWTDHFPNGDFLEAILSSSFDWNGIRQPFIVATENDALNGATMLLGHLLTGSAQIFADVRTYWSPEAMKRVTGHTLSGNAANGILHLINSGPAALDGTGQQQIGGKPAMKPFWKISPNEAEKCLKATTWYSAITEYFRGGGFSSSFLTRGGMPITAARINLVKGIVPGFLSDDLAQFCFGGVRLSFLPQHPSRERPAPARSRKEPVRRPLVHRNIRLPESASMGSEPLARRARHTAET